MNPVEQGELEVRGVVVSESSGVNPLVPSESPESSHRCRLLLPGRRLKFCLSRRQIQDAQAEGHVCQSTRGYGSKVACLVY